jgi:hypothetical protein
LKELPEISQDDRALRSGLTGLFIAMGLGFAAWLLTGVAVCMMLFG